MTWKFWRRQPCKAKTQHELDSEALSRGECPECGAHESLYGGPCAGAGQNVICDVCRNEYVMVGPLVMQRLGVAGELRARNIYGLEPVGQA